LLGVCVEIFYKKFQRIHPTNPFPPPPFIAALGVFTKRKRLRVNHGMRLVKTPSAAFKFIPASPVY